VKTSRAWRLRCWRAVKKAVRVGGGRGSGSQRRELDEVAAVEREVGDLFGGDDLAERGIRGFDGDLGGADLDILSDRRGVEREIDFALLVDLEPDVPLLGGLEALRLHVMV